MVVFLLFVFCFLFFSMEFLNTYHGLNIILLKYGDFDTRNHYDESTIMKSQVPGYYTYDWTEIYDFIEEWLLAQDEQFKLQFNFGIWKSPELTKICHCIINYITKVINLSLYMSANVKYNITYWECLNCCTDIIVNTKCEARMLAKNTNEEIVYHIPPQALVIDGVTVCRDHYKKKTDAFCVGCSNAETWGDWTYLHKVYFFFGNSNKQNHHYGKENDFTNNRKMLFETVWKKCKYLKKNVLKTIGPVCSQKCFYDFCLNTNKSYRKIEEEIVYSYKKHITSLDVPVVIIRLIANYCNFINRKYFFTKEIETNYWKARYINEIDKKNIEKYYFSIEENFS